MARNLLPLLAILALVGGCGVPPPNESEIPAKVEAVEESTESFANTMLDLAVDLRRGSTTEIRRALALSLEASTFPTRPLEQTVVRGWVRAHGWEAPGIPEHRSRDQLILELEEFLAHYSEIEDVRFKVKRSTASSTAVDAKVALQLVGRDTDQRREWTRATISVAASRTSPEDRWTISRFVVTGIESLVADKDLFSEIAVPAGMARQDPPFLARTGPPFAAYGAAAGDIDGDGLLDLVVTSENGNSVFHNRGDGRFIDIAAAVFLREVHGDVVAPLLLDADNDGDLDLFLSAIGTQKLFQNRLVPDGELEFWDVSVESGVARPAVGFSAVAGDVDGNGFPDIYVASYNRYGQVLPDHWDGATNGTPNLLFLNRGNGTFDEVAAEWGVADDRWSYAAAFADIDHDGDQDLYTTNDFGGGNSFFINQGTGFIDRAEEMGVVDGGYGMGASFGDYDNDGDLDLHVTRMSSSAGRRILARLDPTELPTRQRLDELAQGNALYENEGNGSFLNVSSTAGPFAAGWAWGGGFLDFNNDGFEDLYTPNGFISGSRLHDT